MRSFKSNENIRKKEGGSYYVVSANKASSVTLQSPGNNSQRKHTTILRISNRQSIKAVVTLATRVLVTYSIPVTTDAVYQVSMSSANRFRRRVQIVSTIFEYVGYLGHMGYHDLWF